MNVTRYEKMMMDIQKPIIEHAFVVLENNISAVSRELYISRGKLYKLIDRYNIEIGRMKHMENSAGAIESMNKQSYDSIKESLTFIYEKHDRVLEKAARYLGVSKATLFKKLEYYGVDR